jgi:hypothetical protein
MVGFAGVAVLSVAASAWAQDAAPVPPRKLRSCGDAYHKAVDYVLKNHKRANYAARMVAGWLLLADGRFSSDLESVVQAAIQWDKQRHYGDHAKNWFAALAGILLSEHHRHFPREETRAALQAIADHFVKNQEKTGGWFKWFEGAVVDMPKYPVRDLGILDGTILGLMYGAKKLGCKVPEATLQNGERCLDGILGPGGISYGTGQRGGDITGARGGLAMLGLDIAGMRSHRIWETYSKIIPSCISRMDQGHHVGAFHCLGLTLACWKLGHHPALLNEWGLKLAQKQDADGGLYVGDDGSAGGEKGCLGGNVGSTAAYALMVLLQEPNVLKPRTADKPSGAGAGGGSPFSTRPKLKEKK